MRSSGFRWDGCCGRSSATRALKRPSSAKGRGGMLISRCGTKCWGPRGASGDKVNPPKRRLASTPVWVTKRPRSPWNGRVWPHMKFNLLDKILELSDTRIVATKHVSLAEEYLADHFPSFPVLQGVLMLEALTQAAGWVLH